MIIAKISGFVESAVGGGGLLGRGCINYTIITNYTENNSQIITLTYDFVPSKASSETRTGSSNDYCTYPPIVRECCGTGKKQEE
jgi:hypothetical protein